MKTDPVSRRMNYEIMTQNYAYRRNLRYQQRHLHHKKYSSSSRTSSSWTLTSATWSRSVGTSSSTVSSVMSSSSSVSSKLNQTTQLKVISGIFFFWSGSLFFIFEVDSFLCRLILCTEVDDHRKLKWNSKVFCLNFLILDHRPLRIRWCISEAWRLPRIDEYQFFRQSKSWWFSSNKVFFHWDMTYFRYHLFCDEESRHVHVFLWFAYEVDVVSSTSFLERGKKSILSISVLIRSNFDTSQYFIYRSWNINRSTIVQWNYFFILQFLVAIFWCIIMKSTFFFFVVCCDPGTNKNTENMDCSCFPIFYLWCWFSYRIPIFL